MKGPPVSTGVCQLGEGQSRFPEIRHGQIRVPKVCLAEIRLLRLALCISTFLGPLCKGLRDRVSRPGEWRQREHGG